MNDDTNIEKAQCWICSSTNTHLKKQGIDPATLEPDNFTITDANYGTTLTIYQCEDCGFLFCPDAGDVTSYYAELEDQEYEDTRDQRKLQARKLLKQIKRYKPSGTLLDIGAGSGILVEEAVNFGYQASGVEPSRWLVEQSNKLSIPVREGIFPEAIADKKYDIITLIDVLEHVHTPIQLLKDISAHLTKDGIAIIVTPDVKSIAARLLGKKWWHFRVAHISYFEKANFKLALKNSGLEAVKWYRPSWFFPLDYLLLRIGQYIPFVDRLAKIRFVKSITIPLNLLDSWLVVTKRSI